MPITLTFEHEDGTVHHIETKSDESVLSSLLRAGIAVPNSCRAGACQSCLVQATAGPVPAAAQKGLKDSLKSRNFFHACTAVPTENLTIRFGQGAHTRARATVHHVEHLGANVARIRLAPEKPFDYFPGQFINLARPDQPEFIRSYSLASLDTDDHLELHVRKINGGRMSTWLHDHARPGDAVDLRGPAGDCFYVAGRPDQPLLLIGTGTGLAPLYAIARDALRHNHTGPIRLYHGALNPAGLYFVDELRALAARHGNFAYHPCALNSDNPAFRAGAIDQLVLADHPKLAGHRAFLCGDPTLVNDLRKRIYLAGAKMTDIHADAFLTRATP